MKRLTIATALLTALNLVIPVHAETRCGIITNMLPGAGLTLDDRDAAWDLDAGEDRGKLPDLERGEQCGCVTGTTNPATHTFTGVTGGKLKSMKACDADKKLIQAINARNH
jgi:hypothetical protein